MAAVAVPALACHSKTAFWTPSQCNPQVFREPTVDTKVVVASGPDTILVAFRGTASWANVVKDLQARVLDAKRMPAPAGHLSGRHEPCVTKLGSHPARTRRNFQVSPQQWLAAVLVLLQSHTHQQEGRQPTSLFFAGLARAVHPDGH